MCEMAEHSLHTVCDFICIFFNRLDSQSYVTVLSVESSGHTHSSISMQTSNTIFNKGTAIYVMPG